MLAIDVEVMYAIGWLSRDSLTTIEMLGMRLNSIFTLGKFYLLVALEDVWFQFSHLPNLTLNTLDG